MRFGGGLRTSSVEGDGAMDHPMDHFAYDLELFLGFEEQEGMEISYITMVPHIR